MYSVAQLLLERVDVDPMGDNFLFQGGNLVDCLLLGVNKTSYKILCSAKNGAFLISYY